MNKISFVALLVSISFVSDALAAKEDGAAYRTKWEVSASYPTCKGSGADAGFDGSSENIKTNLKWRKYLAASFTESGKGYWGYGAWYWIAHEMNDHGYRFCKTAVGADRSGITKSPFTNYVAKADANKDNGENCFWLCEKGYYGNKCASSTPSAIEPDSDGNDFIIIQNRAKIAAGLNANPLDSSTVATLKGAGQKNSIPMFYHGNYTACSGGIQVDLRKMSKSQEHDVVLAIKNIETDGIARVTYTLQPMVVRAASAKNYADTGWPMISWTGKESKDYCPNEKFLHSDDGGCIGYSQKTADIQDVSHTEKAAYESALEQAKIIELSGLDLLCPGFDRSKYDNKIHELNTNKFEYKNWRTKEAGTDALIADKCNSACSQKTGDELQICSKSCSDRYNQLYASADATCTIFVCKDGMGYASDPKISGDYTCVSCAISADATIHPKRLGLGANGMCITCEIGKVYSDGQCVDATPLNQRELVGVGEAIQSLDEQCWTKANPDEYKKCISEK